MIAPMNTKRCRQRRKTINAANVAQRRMRIVQLPTSTLTASITFVSHCVRSATTQRNLSESHRSKYRANVGNVSTPMAVTMK